LTPTGVAVALVRLTVWAAAVWWLADSYGWLRLARALEQIVGEVWKLALVVAVVLFLGRLVTQRLIDCLQSLPLGESLEVWLPKPGAGESRSAATALAGVVVYGLVALVALLVAADLFGWRQTATALLAVWHLALHSVTAAIAVLIGWLGARWARSPALPDAGTPSPAAQAGHYTALGILAGTTLLAVAVLTGHAGPLFGLAILAVLAIALWPSREYVPDVTAGIQLKAHQVRQVCLDGVVFQVSEVGLLTSQLSHNGDRLTRRNRHVLEAHFRSPVVVEPPCP
jgi:hypothetical protein